MPQNKNLTDERLAQIHKSLKRWADHDNTLNSYISGTKIDPIFHDCVVALAELQERRKADGSVPIAWTDAEELALNLLDVIDEIVDEILAVDTIASTAALKTIFRMKTGKMRLDLACQQRCNKQQLEAK